MRHLLALFLFLLSAPALAQVSGTGENVIGVPGGGVVAKTCSGTDKFSAVTSAGVFTCSADAGGAGSGDNLTVNTTAATDANLLDNAYIDWAINTGSTPDDITAKFNYNAASGDHTLLTNECAMAVNGLVCEGATADAIELYLQVPDPASSDKTLTFPNATDTLVGKATTDTLTNKTLAAADNVIEADTAVALASNPTDCAANEFATTIAASGNLTCAAIADADVPNTITIDLATAASDLDCTDCIGPTEITDSYLLNTGDVSTGDLELNDGSGDSPHLFLTPQTGTQWGLRVQDSGDDLLIRANTAATERVQITNAGAGVADLETEGDLIVTGGDITLGTTSIFSGGDTASLNAIDAIDGTTETTLEAALDIAGDVSGTGLGSVAIGADKVLESMLKAVDAAADEDVFTYESTTGDFEWHSRDEIIAGISAGALPNDSILEADLKAVDAPGDEECLTYEATGGDFEWQSCGVGGSGDSITVNTSAATDPDFADGDIDWTLSGGNSITATVACTGCIDATDLASDSVTEAELKAVDAASDEDVLTYETTTGDFEWHTSSEIIAGISAGALPADSVLEADLKVVDAPGDEECLTYEATDGDFEWQSCGSGAGDITTVGTCTTGDCGVEGGNDVFPLLYEGTANTSETTFSVTDPTADRTLTFPNETGTFCTTGSVCSGYQAGPLTGDVTTSAAAATLTTKHRTRMLTFNLENPAVADDGKFQMKLPDASTLVRVSCSTTAGSVDIQLYERAENSPNSGTTSMLNADLTCDSDTTADATTSFADSAVATDSVVALGVKVDSSTGVLRVFVEHTVD